MRVAFAGTPAFAASALSAVHAAGHDLVLVLTQPDRPAGRGLKLQPSPIKQYALQNGLAVAQPQGLKLDGRFADDAHVARGALQAAHADVMVVAAYGLILPPWLLDLPRLGCLNIHASLLPRWRGAAPIQRAIEAGDTQTGITIMQMDAGLDTGDVLLASGEAILPGDSAGSLQDRLAALGARLIVQALADAASGALVRTPQAAAGVTYAHKLAKAEGAIDWLRPAAEIERRLRAFDPQPGCHFEFDGQTVKLWRASVCAGAGRPAGSIETHGSGLRVSCGDGQALDLLELQRPGGRRLPAALFASG
ncbi:MAG: methionyl-tRNA formyltransferase [Pseudomonadota bacterium]